MSRVPETAIGRTQRVSRRDLINARLLGPISGRGDFRKHPWTCPNCRSTGCGIFATVVFGWLFLIAGIVGLAATLRVREAPGFEWSLLSAHVAVVAGEVLLWNPLGGLINLTYVLIVFFVADGILVMLLALRPSPRPIGKMGVDDGARHH